MFQKYSTLDIVCSGSNSCCGENLFFRDVTFFSTTINRLIFLKILFTWKKYLLQCEWNVNCFTLLFLLLLL